MAKQSAHYAFHASSLNPQFINIFIKPHQCKVKLLYSVCFFPGHLSMICTDTPRG